ncbi:hypothetical protein M4D81_07835 [Paenibacillus sp. p3-SID867]|uniref:hypothetical protein n=1 Tax=Paenibacillus sp. p3-SID867 TaxID=2916363 RepID=UPI0021A7EC61|nr:hypothetical protein [Paenibacillus sp. p3-SID867]MCT1398922.1 hypothetical protein [Paenibacillus sp. p3-SID867]
MDLINRYIYAVTQKLPESQRADIEKELHGLIEDMLEDRGAGVGIASTEDIEQVLLELGPPGDMAARYRGRERYLIGPGLIDSYWSVLRIVLYSVVIALGIAYMVDFFTSSDPTAEKLLEYFISLLSVAIHGFAWVTVIFAYIEYRGARQVSKEAWKPSDLPVIPEPAVRIKPIEPVLGILFSVLFFVLFTFSLNLIGVHRFDENSIAIPVFEQAAFAKYLPLIWLLTAFSIFNEARKLITRKWTPQLAVMHVIFNVASVIVAVILFSDMAIWNPTFMEQLAQTGFVTPGSESYDIVKSVWDRSRDGLIYVIVIITLIDTVSVLMKRFRRKEGNTALTK